MKLVLAWLMLGISKLIDAQADNCVDRLPNCQSNLGLCTQAGELVFQNHYCKATCGNCGVSKENTVPACPAEWDPVSTDLKNRFSRGQLDFAWKLYSHIPLGLRVRHGGNFVISPNSLAQMLATLYDGSSGSTEDLLKDSELFGEMTKNDTKHVYAKMSNYFRRQMAQPLPKATELYASQLMFFGAEYKVTEKFLKVATGCYDTAMMQRKDYENTAQAKQEINKGMQGFAYNLPKKSVLDPADRQIPLNPKTLTLISAAYVKSDVDTPTVVMSKFYPTTKRDGVDVPMAMVEGHMKGIIRKLPIYQMTRKAKFDHWVPALIPKMHGHTVIDVRPPMERMGLEKVFKKPNLDNIFLGHTQPEPISNFYHRTDFQMYDVEDTHIDRSNKTLEKLEELPTRPNNFRDHP